MSCCDDKSCEITALRATHGRALMAVLAINIAMFLIEGGAGLKAQSTSLLADALDMFGDALVYAFSLFVMLRSARWQAMAALVKGALMFALGAGVLAEAIMKVLHPVMPGVATMGEVGALALVANLTCFSVLFRYRDDNLNMRSTWLCSRNDVAANLGVLLAAGSGYLWSSQWPDVLVGSIVAALFLQSALSVLRPSLLNLMSSESAPVVAARRRE